MKCSTGVAQFICLVVCSLPLSAVEKTQKPGGEVSPGAKADLPLSLVRHGGFAQPTGWDLGTGTLVSGGSPGPCLQRDSDTPPAIAILCEPQMPTLGCPSDPKTIAAILDRAGFRTTTLAADQLADPDEFHAGRFDVVILPTGRTFSAKARRNFVAFLRQGGAYVSTGGYAFDDLVVKSGGKWQSQAEVVRAKLDEAMSSEHSLLPDGGFERLDEIPLSSASPSVGWRRSSDHIRVGNFEPFEGTRCAMVDVPRGQLGAQCYVDIPSKPGTTYEVAGRMRTRDLMGDGMAYMAVYQYDAGDTLVEFRDFAVVRETNDWHRHRFSFTPDPAVTRISIRFGLYDCSGRAWFDDFRLGDATGASLRPMNTSTGTPLDGLEVSEAQIGAFDASYELQRACRLRAAPGQHVVREPIDQARILKGWAASGVVGYDNARWIPLLESYDRYARPRGPVGAVQLHYRGYYAGSAMAYFGVENVDLFDDPGEPGARVLEQVVRFLVRRTFLRNLETDSRLYRGEETVGISVIAENGGRQGQRVELRATLFCGDTCAPIVERTKLIELAAGQSQKVEVAFSQFDRSGDLYRVVVTLSQHGHPIDEMTTGFVVDSRRVVSSGPRLRFSDNYFTLGERPVFLFGTDTYSRTYMSSCENPWTWSQELAAARDIGLNLYENLQYTKPDHRMEESDWRAFAAMNQLVQKHGMVFMPGMLIGHNVAIGDAETARQSTLCASYAKRFAGSPGLLYYINGDYRMELDKHSADVRQLWNRWLQDRYRSTAALRSAWGGDVLGNELGQLEFPPPDSGCWDDVAAVDRMRFQNWLVRRWNSAHVSAVRLHDQTHPITSEYYQYPFAGMDLVLTIDGQDVSNIGYFDRPVEDITQLPLKICFNDLRARGKGVSLGEYGVKTHPAWSPENGATHYHIARTEEEQKQLFMAVAHYGLGLGVSKVQNWCLRDAQVRVFPWGMLYPNQLVRKPIAYVHRNQSIVWRHFRPWYTEPELVVCLPNQLRLGNDEGLGRDVAYRTFADLLAMHYAFGTIDDHHLEELPSETKVMILPSPFALRDDAFARIAAWVRGGGTLIVSGDFTYDADRQRTRTDRLEELAGVRFIGERFANVRRDQGSDVEVMFHLAGLARETLRPCMQIHPAGAEVLGESREGQAVLVKHRLGNGTCWLLTDPLHLDSSLRAPSVRRRIFRAILNAGCDLEPIPVTPDADWLHVMQQPTRRGKVHVVYNTRLGVGTESVQLHTAAGPLALTARNRWPAMAAVTDEGAIVAVTVDGVVRQGGQAIVSGSGLKALLSLDGQDVRQSDALLVAPFEPGSFELAARDGPWGAVFGDFHQGTWRCLEQSSLANDRQFDIDQDRATCLILVCRPDAVTARTAQLTEALQRPDLIDGY